MSADPFSHCRAVLREADYDRYGSLSFLPGEAANAAAALFAFDVGISRIPFLVSDPAPGEIRLQWWREVIGGERESGGNPVAEALLQAIQTHQWPVQTFERYLDARVADLYHDPMPDRLSFEGHAGDTASSLLALLAMATHAGQGSDLHDACGHAGISFTVARCLQALARDRQRQRVMIPVDILAATGLDAATFLAGEPDQRHNSAIEAFAAFGADHFAKAGNASRRIDPAGRLSLLSAAPSARLLAKAMRNPQAALSGTLHQSPLASLWQMWRASRSNNGI
ncbi:MAG: squalene/phytoene synthase family protein [Nitratireductor sp.]